MGKRRKREERAAAGTSPRLAIGARPLKGARRQGAQRKGARGLAWLQTMYATGTRTALPPLFSMSGTMSGLAVLPVGPPIHAPSFLVPGRAYLQ